MINRLFLIIGLAILTIGGLKAQAFDFTNNLRVSVGANLGAVVLGSWPDPSRKLKLAASPLPMPIYGTFSYSLGLKK